MSQDPTAILSDQIGRIVSENQRLRVKSDGDDKTIRLLQQQYDQLAGRVDDIRAESAADVKHIQDWAEREISHLTTERDQAVIRFQQMDTLLQQAANVIMQAMRARNGDMVPELIPDSAPGSISDARLAAVAVGFR